MTKTGARDPQEEISVVTEVRRIRTTGVLALILTAIALLLDSPVSILAWLLLAAAILCMIYVVIAARQLILFLHSHDHKAESHD